MNLYPLKQSNLVNKLKNIIHVVTLELTTKTQLMTITILNHTQDVTPPYLERLEISKIPPQSKFGLLGEC